MAFVFRFCWGGYIASQLAATGLFQAAVSVHGCMHDGEDVKKAKAPLFFVTVPNDPFYDAAKIASCEAAGARVHVFDGMYHGFVVRGDFANNDAVCGDIQHINRSIKDMFQQVRAAANTAVEEIVAFVKEHTL